MTEIINQHHQIFESIRQQTDANKTHYEVGAKVRQTIKDLGGTMPENLPTPKDSVKKLEKKHNAIENHGGGDE